MNQQCLVCLALDGVTEAEVAPVDLLLGGFILGIVAARAEHTQGFCPQENLCADHLDSARGGVLMALEANENAKSVSLQSPELFDFSLPGEGS